jgi:hypothetical protein
MRTSLALLAAAAIALSTAFVAARAVGAAPQQQDAKQDKPEAMPGMDPAMMARMMELATPGKEHQELAARAGTWDIAYKFRMAPDAPWMDMKGSATARTLLGGRYLLEEHAFEMMGEPMQGIMLLGFDKESGEYISLWMDSMSTWWVEARGKKDAAGKLDQRGEMKDIAGKRPYRATSVAKPDGSYEHQMYDTIGGKEVLVMTYTAARRK